MQDEEPRNACGDPCHERSLLPAEGASWGGLPVAWLQARPHEVRADLVVERHVLVMIDSGSARADFGYGSRNLSCDLRAGAIGTFRQGTHMRMSHWRWPAARRIAVDLEAATLLGDTALAEQLRAAPWETEIEFHDPELAALVRGMVREAAAGCPNGRLFAESLSLGLALRLQQRAAARHGNGRERGRLAPAQVRKLDELIRTAGGRQVTLAMLAQASGFSPAQFVRLFRNTLGCSPHQYVLRSRLERARAMVVAGQMSLAMVAHETGFASQSHMTSAFVRAYGVPPGEMRRASSP